MPCLTQSKKRPPSGFLPSGSGLPKRSRKFSPVAPRTSWPMVVDGGMTDTSPSSPSVAGSRLGYPFLIHAVPESDRGENSHERVAEKVFSVVAEELNVEVDSVNIKFNFRTSKPTLMSRVGHELEGLRYRDSEDQAESIQTVGQAIEFIEQAKRLTRPRTDHRPMTAASSSPRPDHRWWSPVSAITTSVVMCFGLPQSGSRLDTIQCFDQAESVWSCKVAGEVQDGRPGGG